MSRYRDPVSVSVCTKPENFGDQTAIIIFGSIRRVRTHPVAVMVVLGHTVLA